jgi:CCR4-NOT complex subunit CAF16
MAADLNPLPLVHTIGLTFSYDTGIQTLFDVSVDIPAGARIIMVGSNGAGKSTLLRLMAGKHLVPRTVEFEVLGRRAPQDQIDGLAYLGNNWQRTVAFAGNGVSYQADIPVSEMCKKTQQEFPERKNKLYELLEIDPTWKMHKVSDGQRRRVQIMLALLRPFKLLLLDEMTVDLDVLARAELLQFLKEETSERGATVVYTTHIFDGIDGWGTHILHISEGRLNLFEPVDEIEALSTLRATPGVVSPLLKYIHSLLYDERERRRAAGSIKFEREEFVDGAGHTKDQGGYGSGRGGRFYNYW